MSDELPLYRDLLEQNEELNKLLREAHALLNSSSITFHLPAVPWRDSRDAWNEAFEKVKGGQ